MSLGVSSEIFSRGISFSVKTSLGLEVELLERALLDFGLALDETVDSAVGEMVDGTAGRTLGRPAVRRKTTDIK